MLCTSVYNSSTSAHLCMFRLAHQSYVFGQQATLLLNMCLLTITLFVWLLSGGVSAPPFADPCMQQVDLAAAT